MGPPEVSKQLTGKLKNLSRYNGLNILEDYFQEGMQRLRTQFLSIPLETVLHPVSTEVEQAVKKEQVAADKALEQIEDVEVLVGQSEDKPEKPKTEPIPSPSALPQKKVEEKSEIEILKSQAIQSELRGDFYNALQGYYKIKRLDPLFPSVDKKIRELERELQPKLAAKLERTVERDAEQRVRKQAIPWRLVAGGLILIALCIWGGISIWDSLTTASPEPTRTVQPAATKTPQPVETTIATAISSKDGMTLLYVPAGEFMMGSEADDALAECQKYRSDCQRDWFTNEEPPHAVNVDAFWIDRTEVTNAMYAKCEDAGVYNPPSNTKSYTRNSYYGDSEFDDYPVIYVDWNMAKTYCEWAVRRLPTESEWEKAARGTDRNIYPWGNDTPGNNLLNYNSAIGDTTAVGKYPNGTSPYGALDMAGNVWEWVDDWYDVYPGNTVSDSGYGTKYRVLRGGSWGS